MDDPLVEFRTPVAFSPLHSSASETPLVWAGIQTGAQELLTRTAARAPAAATASTGGTMNPSDRHASGIPGRSAWELVAATVVVYRWQRDYLQALAREQQCTLSAVLRVLLDQALGTAPEEAAPATSDERSQDEPDEPATGRSIRLEPRHRELLAVIADRRALSVSALLGAILDSWVEDQLPDGD
jgi:hypothetical protein